MKVRNQNDQTFPVVGCFYLPLAAGIRPFKGYEFLNITECQHRPRLVFGGGCGISRLNMLCDEPERKSEHGGMISPLASDRYAPNGSQLFAPTKPGGCCHRRG